MANVAGRLAMKVLTIAVGIPVGIATKKAVEATWSTTRSSDRPRKPKETGVRWTDAVGWAALSAAGVVAAELITRRGAEEVWRIVLGTEPPPPKTSKAEKKLERAAEKVEASS
ncbi:MAG: hypothetical protein QOG80_2507 [Pseudonocardiales bacterium]|jgi:hypothetical protein|nr:hypothetical protein [Pseudonocardiales bacterium]